MRERLLFGVESLMAEDAFMVTEVDFVEVVHVELAHKGGEPVVSVVAGEDSLLQSFLVDDADAFFFRVPNDGFGVLFGLSKGTSTLRML